MADDRPALMDVETAQDLINVALREGPDGVRKQFARRKEELEEEDSFKLIVAWTEVLLPVPGARGALISEMGAAINHLSKAGRWDWVLRALAASARCQIEEGVWREVPGLINTLEQLADRMQAAPYQALARLLRGQSQLAQGHAEEGVATLNSLVEDLTPVASLPAVQELLRRAYGLLTEHGLASGDLRVLETGLSGLRGLPGADKDPVVALHSAWAARLRRKDEEAIQQFHHLLTLAQNGLDSAWAMEAHLGLAEMLPWEADEHLGKAEDLARARGASWALLRVQMARTRAYLTRGHFAQALAAAAVLESQDDPRALGLAVEVRLSAGHGEAVRPAAERLLQMAKEKNYPGNLALANLYLGMACSDPQEKAMHFDAAQAWAVQAGDAALRARALTQMSLLASAIGKFEAAAQAAELAEQEARGVGEVAALAFALLARGQAEPEHAQTHYERCLALAEQAGDTALRIRALNALGRKAEARALSRDAGLSDDES